MERAVLLRMFGYDIDSPVERYVIWRGHTLIVLHPEHLPKIYREGCKGVYSEFDPSFT